MIALSLMGGGLAFAEKGNSKRRMQTLSTREKCRFVSTIQKYLRCFEDLKIQARILHFKYLVFLALANQAHKSHCA